MTLNPLTFTVPGPPVPKLRARRGRDGRWYTPTKVRKYEKYVGLVFLVAHGPAFRPWANCPVRLEARFYLPIPASRPKWWRTLAATETVLHIGTPDGSNLLKCVEDGLNGMVWRDDAQVAEGAYTKRYSPKPRVEITIWRLEDTRAKP